MKSVVAIASVAIFTLAGCYTSTSARGDVVRADGGVASPGAAQTSHAAIVDDADNGWTWSSMVSYPDIGLAKGTGHAGGSGSYGVYTFNGTGVEVFVMRGNSVNVDGHVHRMGKLKISVDGHVKGEVILAANAVDYNISAINVSGMPSKLHVLQLEPDAGWAVIDYIKVNADEDPAEVSKTAGDGTPSDPGVLFSGKDTMLYGVNVIEGRNNVGGFNDDINPELQIGILPDDWGFSQIYAHSGKTAVRYSGKTTGPQAYCYMYAWAVRIPVASNTWMSYWMLPQQDNGRYVAVDLHCTDGTTLSGTQAVDTEGVPVAPANGHGGNLPLYAWTNSRCHVGQWLAGKTIDKIWIGYARQNGSGQYRGYIDDLVIDNETGSR